MKSATTVAEYDKFVASHGEFFADMGIPRLMSSKLHDRDDLIQSILKHALVYRWVYMSSLGNVYCVVVSRNASVTVI